MNAETTNLENIASNDVHNVDMDTLVTDNYPVQSPIKSSFIKDNALAGVVAVLAVFLVVMAVLMGSHIGSNAGATIVTSACDNTNHRYEGKVPAEYNDNIKAFQDAEPELASKMLIRSSLGCGQYVK